MCSDELLRWMAVHWSGLWITMICDLIHTSCVLVLFSAMATASCGEPLSWRLPPELEWLTFVGGCSIEPTITRPLIIAAIVLTTTSAAFNWVFTTMGYYRVRQRFKDPEEWSLLAMFESDPTFSSTMAVSYFLFTEFLQALVLVSVGVIPSILLLLYTYFISPLIISRYSLLALPSDKVPDAMSKPAIMLPMVLASLDNSSDIATAMTMGFRTPIGLSYWIFSVLSILHHILNLSFSVSHRAKEVRTLVHFDLTDFGVQLPTTSSSSALVHPSSSPSAAITASPQPASIVPQKRVIEDLKMWLGFKVLGSIGFEVPLMIMDFYLLAGGVNILFRSQSRPVIVFGLVTKVLTVIMHGAVIGWNLHSLHVLRAIPKFI